MTYPPVGPGYPDGGGYGSQPQQPGAGGWPPAPGYSDPAAPAPGYGADPYPQSPGYGADPYAQPGGYGQPPVSATPVSGSYGQPPVSVNPMGQPSSPFGQPAGFGQPNYGGQPGYPSPQPPSSSRTGLIIGLMAAVVLLVGGGITVAVLANGGNDDDLADPKSPAPTSQSADPSSEVPSEPAADGFTELTYADFATDWTSDYGTGEATFSNGWDYPDCSGLEDGTVLTDMGCEFGVELAWEAEDGDLRVSGFYLGMTDDSASYSAYNDIEDGDFFSHDEGVLYDFEYGMWLIDYVDNVVVLTVVTAIGVDDDTCDSYLSEMNEDMATTLKTV